MKRIIEINPKDIELLKKFISGLNEAAKTFRYFNTREPSVISNHLVTLLMLINEQPIAYGHLEKEGRNTWLGICVLPKKSKQGIGEEMMKALIGKAKRLGLQSIELTVDKDNEAAIHLYIKMGFRLLQEFNGCHKFQLTI